MKEILMGNDAIALGLVHAGVDVVSGYPGTPSSEILGFYQGYKKKFNLDAYAEWATNEKVGFEVAYSTAISGKFACATMKQVGLNVASDALMSASYIGQKGAMLLVSADDPGFYSSQTEQDSRSFAKFARIPVFDPSTPQDAYNMVKEGVKLSHEFETPVMLRPVMRVCHAREICEVDEFSSFQKQEAKFERNISRWAAVPPAKRYPQGVEQLERIEKLKIHNWEHYIEPKLAFLKNEKVLCVTSGTADGYVREVLSDFSSVEKNLKADVLKLDMPYPLPKEKLEELFKNYELVIVFEETYPCIEEQLEGVLGKQTKHVHEIDEFSKDKVLQTFSKVGLVQENNFYKSKKFEQELPVRPPNMCPGCPHRDVYFSIMKTFKRSKSIYPSDIGCYTLAINQGAIDSYLCMGASVSMAGGFALANPDKTVVATLGDSTFFHSGVAPLINAVYQRQKFILIILDNSTVAMTGRQVTPERVNPKQVDIKRVVEGCGVTCHEYMYTPALDKMTDFMKFLQAEYQKADGPVVAVVREYCVLDKERKDEFYSGTFATVDKDKCISCNICTTQYKCPPMSYDINKKVEIDPFLCVGCSACIGETLCPTNAFEEIKSST